MEYIFKPLGIHCTTTSQSIVADTPVAAVFLATNALEAARRALAERPANFQPSELERAMLDLHRSLTQLEQKFAERLKNEVTVPANLGT